MEQEEMERQIRAIRMGWVVLIVLNIFTLAIAVFITWTAFDYNRATKARMEEIEKLLLSWPPGR